MNNNMEAFKSSVMLCAKRLSLIKEINEVDAVLGEGFMTDSEFVKYYAKNYVRKGSVLLRFLFCVACLVPFVLVLLKYKLVDDSGSAIAIIGNIFWIAIFVILTCINNLKKKSIARKNYLPDYAKRRETVENSREQLKSYKAELQQELGDLLEMMQDRNICILHQNYWDDALKIWSLVELGRATSMASAINLFESLKQEKKRDAVLQQQLENSQKALESQMRSERYARSAAESSERAEMYSLFAFANTIGE